MRMIKKTQTAEILDMYIKFICLCQRKRGLLMLKYDTGCYILMNFNVFLRKIYVYMCIGYMMYIFMVSTVSYGYSTMY